MIVAVAVLLGSAGAPTVRKPVGAPSPVATTARNVSRAAQVAIAGMNVRISHYCRSQGAIEEWELVSAATEVQSDSLAYELEFVVEGRHPATAQVLLRESTGKMVFASSVPYCCSVRADSLANRRCDVEKHNADPGRTYDADVYKMFQGRTYASLARQYLGLRTRPIEAAAHWAAGADPALEKALSAPDAYDFRTENPHCKLPPRDQGSCGSCWAQSNTGMLEDRLCKASAGELRVRLSVQQHVSCNKLCLPRPNADLCQAGCEGGFQDLSGAYLEMTGLVEDSTLPYGSGGSGSYEDHFGSKDSGGSCPNSKLAQHPHFKAEPKSTRMLRGSTEMMHELSHAGPVDVAMTVYNDFWNYRRGVYSSNPSSGQAGGHAVKMIGYGIDNGVPYWTCQNSWGSGWGEQGFFRSRRGDRIGLEHSAWVIMPIVPNVAVIENEVPSALPPPPSAPPPPPDCPKKGRAARRCRNKADKPESSSPSLMDQLTDTIAYHFKRFFGFDTGQPAAGGGGGPPLGKALALARAPDSAAPAAAAAAADTDRVSLVISEKRRRRGASSAAAAPTPTPEPGVPESEVNGFVKLISEHDGEVVAMEPFVDIDGRMAVDRSLLAPGVYRIALCDRDGITCEVEDDKLHVAACPTVDGVECGGHGYCHASAHASAHATRGRCVCEDGYGGPACRPQCPQEKELHSGCAVRSGIWDTDTKSPIGTEGNDALYTLKVREPCTLTLSTCHAFTNFDTKLSLFDGCPLQSSGGIGEPLASNDDNCTIDGHGTASTLEVELGAGSYTVLVEGLDAHDIGNFQLSAFGCGEPGERRAVSSTRRRRHSAAPATPIDSCPPYEPRDASDNVCLLTALELKVGDRITAQLTGHEGLYVITPQTDVAVEFSTCGSQLDTRLNVYHGCPHRGGHLMSQSDDECGSGSYLVLKLTKGVDYYVQVEGYEGETGSYELSATQAEDLCWGSDLVSPIPILSDADELARMGSARDEIVKTISGDTCFATSIAPPHTSPDMLYVFSLAAPADVDIYTCAADGVTNFNTVLRLASDCYYEPSSTELVHVGMDSLEPTCPPGELGAAFYGKLAPGNYTLEVTSDQAECGSFRLHMGITPAPPTQPVAGKAHSHRPQPAQPAAPTPAPANASTSAQEDTTAGLSEQSPDEAHHPLSHTRHGCTCLENWEYKSVMYHGCDPNQPNAHGAWCPVAQKHCGKMLHHRSREQLAHPTATGYWDWCRPSADELRAFDAASRAAAAAPSAGMPVLVSAALVALVIAAVAGVGLATRSRVGLRAMRAAEREASATSAYPRELTRMM